MPLYMHATLACLLVSHLATWGAVLADIRRRARGYRDPA